MVGGDLTKYEHDFATGMPSVQAIGMIDSSRSVILYGYPGMKSILPLCGTFQGSELSFCVH